MHDLTREMTPEEEAALTGSKTARRDWQRELAISQARPRSRSWRWYGLAAALALAAGGVWLLHRRDSRIETLLAEAYTQHRPFEFRLPAAGYGAVHTERGAHGAAFSKPPSLLQAQAELAREAASDSRSLKWRGVADLLDLSPEAAVHELSQAHDEAPEDAATVTDLAIAYALRGEMRDRAIDYTSALDLLSAEVKKGRGGPQALFNRALVRERLRMYPEAAEDWRAYLKLDNSSPWADEARRHLKDDAGRGSLRDRLRREVGEDSRSFLQHAAPEHPDDYLEHTALDWLSRLPDPDAARALARLASLLQAHHGDRWLADAIAEARAKPGAADLEAIADDNLRGEPDAVLAAAPRLIAAFERSRQPAFAARAIEERVYALHRAVRAGECMAAAQSLDPVLERASYRWLSIQNRLEHAACGTLLGEWGASIREFQQQLSDSRAAGFLNLQLRAAGLVAEARTAAGEAWSPWTDSLANLDEYWRSGVSPARAHQLYLTMATAASRLDLRFAAVELAEAALDHLSQLGNHSTQAVVDSVAAGMATKAGLAEEAAGLLDRAAADASLATRSKTMDRYQCEAEFCRIEADLDRGRLAEARQRLALLDAPFRPMPPGFALSLRKDILAGQIDLEDGDYGAAEQRLASAMQSADRHLASLAGVDRVAVLESAGQCVKSLMEAKLAAGGDPREALRLWLGFLSRDQDSQALPLRVNDETWLVYTELGQRIAAWILDDRGADFRWLQPPPAQIASEVRLMLDLASDAASTPAARGRESRLLYDQVLAPFASRLANDRPLTIVADGSLAAAPFRLLESGDGGLLMEHHVVVHSSRFSNGLLRQQSIGPSSSVVVVAQKRPAAIDDGDLPPLPEAEAEARSVAARFRDAALLEDDAASPQQIAALSAGADLFHFSGHGFSNADNGGLLLKGGVLAADRIAHMNWSRCRVAVLSACLTAAGESRGPVNPNSLVRSFLASGAGSVVAAQWNIDSLATRRLMDAFYDSLVAGASVPAALNRAALALRARPEFSHPYFWGAFQVFQ